MTDHDFDERLRAAFQSPAADPPGPLPDDVQEQIWQAVCGDLDPDQRRALVERTATDPAAAEAWRVASALWDARRAGAGPARGVGPADAPRTQRPRVWGSPWLAAAAALVLVSTIVTVQYWRGEPGDEFRVAPDAAVESLVPEDTSLPRDAFRLRWTGGPENARYRIRVTTEDLRVVATAAELIAPEYVVAPAALAELPDGVGLLWQVEASVPAGPTVTSPTFFVRVR